MKIRLLKISKQILSDLHFNSEEALKDYLEKHKVRPTTKVFVNGVPRDVATYKKKVDEKPQRLSPEDMNGSLTDIYNHAIKNNIDIDNIPPYYKKGYAETLNHVAKAKGINDSFDEKRFEELFNKFLDETGKRKKKEEPKKDNSEDRNSELEKISKSGYTNAFKIGNMSRKDYFDHVNNNLKELNHNELNEDEFKNYLRKNVFKFNPSSSIKEAEKYTKNNFCEKFGKSKFNMLKLEDVNTINETLNNLRIDFPVFSEELFNEVKTNNRRKSDTNAVYRQNITTSSTIDWIEINGNAPKFKGTWEPYSENSVDHFLYGAPYSASNRRKDIKESISSTITHEFGHKLFYLRAMKEAGLNKKTQNYFNFNNSYYNSNFVKEWGSLYSDYMRTPSKLDFMKKNISVYAATNEKEFFAEMFATYRFEKEILPQDIREKMEEFIKWSSAEK